MVGFERQAGGLWVLIVVGELVGLIISWVELKLRELDQVDVQVYRCGWLHVSAKLKIDLLLLYNDSKRMPFFD